MPGATQLVDLTGVGLLLGSELEERVDAIKTLAAPEKGNGC